jgi:hypothetical protein
MTEEELREYKLQLAHCEMQRDESDLSLSEMEENLEKKIPSRLLDDDIEKLEKDIKDKVIYDSFGKKIPASDADIDRMNITLKKFKMMKKLDIPGKKLRQSINQLRDAKLRPDAPELQIKKLKKAIREKAYEVVDNDKATTMHD